MTSLSEIPDIRHSSRSNSRTGNRRVSPFGGVRGKLRHALRPGADEIEGRRARRQRRAAITGVGIEPGTFNYGSKRLYVDVLGEYYFWKRVAVFVNLRNVGDATEDTEILGPSTPEHAQFRQRIDYASLWTIGVKGTF